MNKNIQKLLITGSTGLVGSRFIELCKNNFSIITLGRNNVDIETNITSKKDVLNAVNSSDADAVINFAAYTNVNEAENQKGDENGEVYILNSQLPLWLLESCKNTGKILYHISTDYVFDGKRKDHPYTEEDTPSPVDSWYSITKYYGEQNLLNSNQENFAIIRISYPYSGVYTRKLDIARAVVEKLKNNEEYFGISDQKIKPTSVDDVADALKFLLIKNATGIYHVAGNFSPNKYITPFGFASKIAQVFQLDSSLIKPVSFEEFSQKRGAPRPQNTWLDTTKIKSLGFSITGIDEALIRFKKQLFGN